MAYVRCPCQSNPVVHKRVKSSVRYQFVDPKNPASVEDISHFCKVGDNEYAARIDEDGAIFVGVWTNGNEGVGSFRYFDHDGREHTRDSGLVLCTKKEMKPIDSSGRSPVSEDGCHTPFRLGRDKEGNIVYFLGKLHDSSQFGIVRKEGNRFSLITQSADGKTVPHTSFDVLCDFSKTPLFLRK